MICSEKELLPIYKEHNLSSIHNFDTQEKARDKVVTNIQRTQFKFNSQLFSSPGMSCMSCYQYTKNTI